MRFRFIEDRRADCPVTVICSVLGVSPAGYYAWRSRPESRRSAANRHLIDDIKRVHRDTHGRYGSPRIHVELKAQGRGVSRGRIERLMRHHGVRAIMARPRRVRTTDSRHDFPIAPNLLDRNFTAAAPNRIWLADITYIETDQGWLYLAAVMDLYSRRIVGWAMEDHLRAELPLTALRMAVSAQRPGAGLIHHSDRGCSICLGGLPQGDAVRRLPSLNERQSRLLRQRPDGELLSHAQNRARPSQELCNTGRGNT
jgi:putative transposase